MSGKNSKKGGKQSRHTKKNNGLLLAAALMVTACLAVVFFTGQSGKETESNDDSPASGQMIQEREIEAAVTIAEGESLVIPASDVTTDASFFPVEVDGTTMEVIAVRDSDGTIRTAFNTCQICYGSGRGYYVQQGNVLVCQNCGNRFTMNQVGIESGGCNPWPIFEEDRSVTDDAIEISYDFLKESKDIFANWKVSY